MKKEKIKFYNKWSKIQKGEIILAYTKEWNIIKKHLKNIIYFSSSTFINRKNFISILLYCWNIGMRVQNPYKLCCWPPHVNILF